MQINWFTVVAQIINFLILVWLLKKFLYKPVLDAIDEREKKIKSQLADADAKKAEADKEKEEFSKKNQEFDQQKQEMMVKAVAETKAERQKLLEQARIDANTLGAQLDKTLKESENDLNHEIVQKTQQQVFAISRKALADLASVSLEEQMANTFIKRLKELKNGEKDQFVSAFKSGPTPILVRSAFDLPLNQQAEIQKTINEILGATPQFQFKTLPEIISGIELTANGYKLAWSISEYLDSLEKSISEIIVEKPEVETKTDRAAEPKAKAVKEPLKEPKVEPKKQ